KSHPRGPIALTSARRRTSSTSYSRSSWRPPSSSRDRARAQRTPGRLPISAATRSISLPASVSVAAPPRSGRATKSRSKATVVRTRAEPSSRTQISWVRARHPDPSAPQRATAPAPSALSARLGRIARASYTPAPVKRALFFVLALVLGLTILFRGLMGFADYLSWIGSDHRPTPAPSVAPSAPPVTLPEPTSSELDRLMNGP